VPPSRHSIGKSSQGILLTNDIITLFVPTLGGAGAERVAINLTRGLVNAGARVDLVAIRATGGAFSSHVPEGARLFDLQAGGALSSLPSLVRYLRRERPAALIGVQDHTSIVALWARRLARVPTRVIPTVHLTLSMGVRNATNRRSKIMPHFMKAFYPWADMIVAVSQGVADDLVRMTGLPADRVEVIYNPVITPSLLAAANTPPPHPWLEPGQPPVVMGVGRLTAQKDFATLVRAFARVRERRRARLMILGEGDHLQALQALSAELGVADDVALPGFIPDPYTFMARAAVFALSSAWEGLPTVLIEGLALAERVVATDCPSGPREILQQGRFGQLVPVGDPEALGNAILAALDKPPVPVPAEALAPFTEQFAVAQYLRAAGVGKNGRG
jgi:glycosyltransferase involved in cell wall biosynthesis